MSYQTELTRGWEQGPRSLARRPCRDPAGPVEPQRQQVTDPLGHPSPVPVPVSVRPAGPSPQHTTGYEQPGKGANARWEGGWTDGRVGGRRRQSGQRGTRPPGPPFQAQGTHWDTSAPTRQSSVAAPSERPGVAGPHFPVTTLRPVRWGAPRRASPQGCRTSSSLRDVQDKMRPSHSPPWACGGSSPGHPPGAPCHQHPKPPSTGRGSGQPGALGCTLLPGSS